MNHLCRSLLVLCTGCSSVWTVDDGILGSGSCAQPFSIYQDADGDGFGDPQRFLRTDCLAERGESANALDCDDTTASSFPGADEVCDGVDSDCDGLRDDDDAIDRKMWFLDQDGDGYGSMSPSMTACDAPTEAHVEQDGDCDDTNEAISPSAEETCDEIDNDCDGLIDEDVDEAVIWFRDADADGYGDDAVTAEACTQPPGYAAVGGDCWDDAVEASSSRLVFPGSTSEEVPYDGIDTNCDGLDTCTDLDCDSIPDIVLPNYGTTDGSRAASTTIHFNGGLSDSLELELWGVYAAAADDLDGDGYIDLVVASESSDASYEIDSVVVWGAGPGDPSRFTRVTRLPTKGARDVAISDLNDDGYPDIVFANHQDDRGLLDVSSVVYWGGPSGVDRDRSTPLPTHGATQVEVIDIDQDGLDELVFCNEAAGNTVAPQYATDSSVYWNSGGSVPFLPSERTDFPTIACQRVNTADANSDGVLDLFFSGWEANTGAFGTPVAYLSMTGETRHESSFTLPLPLLPTFELLPARVRSSGVWDLVALPDPDATSTAQPPSVLYDARMAAPMWLGPPTALTTAGTGLGVAIDLNGDGLDELILPAFSTGDSVHSYSTIYFGDSGGYSASRSLSLSTNGARAVAVADINQDGWRDIVYMGSWTPHNVGTAGVFLGSGTPSPTEGFDTEPDWSLDGVAVTRALPLIVGVSD